MVGNCAVFQSENTVELKGKRIAFQQTIITDEKSKHGHEDTGRLKAASDLLRANYKGMFTNAVELHTMTGH